MGEKNPTNLFLISEYHPTMSMTCLGVPWHASGKTSKGEDNVPRARTYPTENVFFTRCTKPRTKVCYQGERYNQVQMINHYE